MFLFGAPAISLKPWPGLGRRRIHGKAFPGRIFVAHTADELQEQLGSLMEEARAARMRAEKARTRLMRLTEAVEQMSQRAAAEVRAGNESGARKLLMEKKSVMSAVEQSKRRAELLEELAAKLNEAISKKESRLISSLSSASYSEKAEESTEVRIVSPKEEADEAEVSGGNEQETSGLEPLAEPGVSEGGERPELLPFYKFMLGIDIQIALTEEKLEQFLEVANILQNNNESSDERVTIVKRMLKDLQQARSRISGINEADEEDQ